MVSKNISISYNYYSFFNILDYDLWYHNAINNIHQKIEISNENVYWGFMPMLFGKTDIKRPDNSFSSTKNSFSQHFLDLFNSDYRFFVPPFPVFASMVLMSDSDNEIYENDQTLCDFKRNVLLSSIEDDKYKMCLSPLVNELQISCCPPLKNNSSNILLTNSIIDSKRPNWRKLIPSI